MTSSVVTLTTKVASRAANDAVIVARSGGRIVSANQNAHAMFGNNGEEIDLWVMAQQVHPTNDFLQLFAAEGRAVLQLTDRLVEATSHQITVGDELQIMVVLRERAPQAAGLGKEEQSSSHSMLIISEISRSISASLDLNTTLDAILNNLGRLVEFDAGEVCLWHSEIKQLQPVGRAGDEQYHADLDEIGGYYNIDEGFSGWIAG